MKNRLTKFFTVFLAVVLCIGMAPATGSTAYAASRWGGSSISNWWNSWVGGSNSGSNKNNSSSNSNQAGKNDATGQGSNQFTANSADETGTADEIQLTKKAVANGTTEDGKPKFNIQLGVKGKEVKKGAPVDFTLVVDLSASMTDNGSQSLEITKNAAKSFINTVLANGNKNVRVAIVAYGTMGHAYNFAKKSWDLYGSTKTDGYYTDSSADALAVIDSDNFAPRKLSPTSGRNYTKYESGGTNTEAGFLTAQAVTATRKSNAMSKVVFMTDGVPTYHYSDGTTVTGGMDKTTEDDFNEAVSAGKALKAAGNDIYTVGLLTSYRKGSDKLEMANKLLSDEHSYSYGRTSSVSYNEIIIKNNGSYYINKDNLWIKDGEDYVQVQVDKKWNKDQYTYTYTQNGETKTVTSKGLTTNPKLTLYTKTEHQGTLGYTENGAAYSDKYYPITDANTAADQIKEIYTNIAKESLVLATGDIVDYIPDGFTVDETSVREAGGTISTDASGKTIVKFPGVPAGKDVATKTFTVVYTGDKYGVAYTNTKATYSGTLYDTSKFSKDFPLPVVGLNPATTDDEYYLDPNTDSNLAILDNDTLNQITDDGYSISGLKVEISNVPSGVKAKAEKVNGQYVVIFNGPAGDYEFNYVITATATKGNTSVGLPAEGQDGWNTNKTQFTITSRVTKVKVHIVTAANQAYVVDFGKPVTYTDAFTLAEKQATITLDGATNNVKAGTYGQMTLNGNGDSITYKLTKFMDGIDKFTFNENYKGKKQLSKDVFMVPASSIYYEDSFGDGTIDENKNPNTAIKYGDGWRTTGEDKIDFILGDGEYGSDSKYANNLHDSGTVHYVKGKDKAVTADFEFTGTGIDIYSRVSSETGTVTAEVYNKSGDRMARQIINAVSVDGTRYQIPVFTFSKLERDTYTVRITVNAGETYYLDGVRIYSSINENTKVDSDKNKDTTVGDIYNKDNEANATLYHLRNRSLSSMSNVFTLTGKNWITQYENSQGQKVVAHEADVGSRESRVFGPTNEIYLNKGQKVTLTLKDTVQFKSLQLGVKTIEGASKVTINGTETTLNSATDMFVKINGTSKTITIKNTGDNIISLTYLKVVQGK